MGPNVKFVSPICDLISERKNRGNFHIYKKTIPGGGGPRGGCGEEGWSCLALTGLTSNYQNLLSNNRLG